MEEKMKCLALVGGGALVGAVSTLFLLKLLPRRIPNQCDKRATKMNETTSKCGTDSGNGNCGMLGLNLLADEIVCEQLTRNIQFFGLDSQQKVTTSYVVVIGLGGVGSHAASMLLRSGVSKLLLVDFDQWLAMNFPTCLPRVPGFLAVITTWMLVLFSL